MALGVAQHTQGADALWATRAWPGPRHGGAQAGAGKQTAALWRLCSGSTEALRRTLLKRAQEQCLVYSCSAARCGNCGLTGPTSQTLRAGIRRHTSPAQPCGAGHVALLPLRLCSGSAGSSSGLGAEEDHMPRAGSCMCHTSGPRRIRGRRGSVSRCSVVIGPCLFPPGRRRCHCAIWECFRVRQEGPPPARMPIPQTTGGRPSQPPLGSSGCARLPGSMLGSDAEGWYLKKAFTSSTCE